MAEKERNHVSLKGLLLLPPPPILRPPYGSAYYYVAFRGKWKNAQIDETRELDRRGAQNFEWLFLTMSISFDCNLGGHFSPSRY